MEFFRKKIKLKFLFRRQDLKLWYADFIINILESRYEVVLEEIEPDFVFHDTHLIEVLEYDCVRIALTGENVRTDFNISDYGIGFDYISFQDRYLRFPLYLFYKGSVDAVLDRPNWIKYNSVEHFLDRKFCNFLVSNGSATEFRSLFFELLSKYRSVDSGGRYLNNIGEQVNDKSAWQNAYKFSLCFENSSTSGYLTEKLIQAYIANTIPIYWGDPDAIGSIKEGKGGINPEAVVWVDRKNPELALKQIKDLDSDPDLYIEMLKKPLFLDYDHAFWFEKSLHEFLFSIFDQDREEAYRRGFSQIRLRVENRNIARSSMIKSLVNYLKKRIRL